MKVDYQSVLNSEKLESISHLSSALAHEIRNPLTVAKGFLQLIASNDFDNEKNSEYVQIAISEMDRAEKIIRNFLTYAKPEIKGIKNVSLAEEIKKVLLILEPLAHQNAVQIFFDLQCDGNIFGESSLIQQCLLNLCKNAIEAMEGGGTLSIYLCEDCYNLHLDIHDTGVGMGEEQLRQLGKPFFSSKGDKGTGLGLYATFNILEKLNATIKVTSKLTEGTLFSLTFPLLKKELKNKNIKNEKRSSHLKPLFN